MSAMSEEESDVDAKPSLAPSDYLEAPSSSHEAAEDAKPDITQFYDQGDAHDGSIDGDDDEYGSDEERENRFRGHESNWMRYTANERALVSSLNQSRAGDLSIHLYNAHAMKAQLYDKDVAANAKPWQSKRTWTSAKENGFPVWHPDPSWTAWPLPALDVPRKSEVFGVAPNDELDAATLRKDVPWKPSQNLEEEIQALMLRQANLQFRQRTWGTSEADMSVQFARSRSRSRATGRTSSRHESGSDAEDDDPGGNLASHQANASAGNELERPVMTADDDEASRLLAPSSRHILSKLDDLLMALHRSKVVQHERISALEDVNTDTANHKRKRRSTAGEAGEAAPGEQPTHERSAGSRRVKTAHRDYEKHPSGPHNLKPRGWSEVLGTASLVGWSPAVIDRATKRCAALFGENMTFRTMPETAVNTPADSVVEYRPGMIPDLEHSSDDEESEDEAEDTTGFACPEAGCKRQQHPYEQCWRLNEHLRKAHGYTRESIDDFLRVDDDAAAESGFTRYTQGDDGSGAVDTAPQDRMLGAVHEDGFMQPIVLKRRRGQDLKPRSRTSSKAPRKASDSE